MEFRFDSVAYDRQLFIAQTLPAVPKRSGVYRIFDRHGKLIVLDKTSNLRERLERFFGERSFSEDSEMLRDLDLREITSRIEFRSTDSPFETTYLLYRERRVEFPKGYRKMRTFRFFTLMKINRKQRFPRVYATRQVKAGVDYFGPFISRGQFHRLKTALERTFKLRPCLYNIRGNDPHADCLYFQMHTCSRPCNNDIDRAGYLLDVEHAVAFVQGRDAQIEGSLVKEMETLAADMQFEAAERVHRQLEKVRRARQEFKDTFLSLWGLNAVVVLPTETVSRCRVVFVREGGIAAFEEYEVESLSEVLPADAERYLKSPLDVVRSDWQYDEFCLVANYIIDPLQSVDVVLIEDGDDVVAKVIERIQQRKRKRKKDHVDTVA